MDLLPKYLNELQDSNKMKRCAAYKKMTQLVTSDQISLRKEDGFNIIRTCLRGFEDGSERCREEAVTITTALLPQQDASALDWVLPSIVTRIGVAPVSEESEEIRLKLLLLASKCMELFPHEIGPRNYIDFFQVLLENCFKDQYPDLKKEACKAAVLLCTIEPQQVRSISAPLAKALKTSCLLHKHSAVRCEAVHTLAVLIQHGAVEVLADGKDEAESRTTASQLFVLCNDHSEPVRLAVLSVLSCALLDVKERLEQHSRYMPHLLLLATDSFDDVRCEAVAVLEKVGKLYMMDNEDNRIDLSNRRISMKDIEWYADDDYPNMILSSPDANNYPVLRQRPTLGARYAVAEATRTFLERILSDVVAIDWVIPFSNNNRRVVVLRILWMAVLHCEKSTVQFTESILRSLYKALRDDNEEVKAEAVLCVEILGKFLTPDQYLPFLIARRPANASAEGEEEEEAAIVQKSRTKTVLLTSAEERATVTPTLFSTAAVTTKCSILVALGYLVRGSEEHLSATHATQVVQTLTSNDIVESENETLLLTLLDTLDILFEVFARRGFIATPERPLPAEVLSDARQRTLDSILLYALLRIKSCELLCVSARATNAIQHLSLLVTRTPEGTYTLHALRLLTRYGNTLPVAAFADLVLRTTEKQVLSSLLVDIFCSKLSEINFAVRVTDELRYFSVLEQLLWGKSICFTTTEMEELLRVVIVPLGAFQPGNAAHLFRKIAINCVCAITDHFFLDSLLDGLRENDCALSTKLLTLWASASDSDDGEMRLVCMTVLGTICQFPLTAGMAHEIIQSVLLRFDDANDGIRLRSIAGLLSVLRAPADTVDRLILKEVSTQMVPIVKKLLIYMDDDEEVLGIRPTIMDTLMLLGDMSPNIVIDLVRAAMEKHADPTYCATILNHIASQHQ